VSKIEELLRAKRQIQIAQFEGREPEKTHEEVDAQIEKVVAQTRRERPRQRRHVHRKRLYITPHARKRMGQRRMTLKHVYALWTFGEPQTLNDTSRTAHVCTDRALGEMPRKQRDLLAPFRGCAIIVQAAPEDDPGKLPAVITVIADGEDTHFG
jgi:hypothetical protein